MASLEVKPLKRAESPSPSSTSIASVDTSKRKSSLEKLRAGSTKSCPICNKAVYLLEKHVHKGKSYHKACFKCKRCHKSLLNISVEWLDSKCFCTGCLSRENIERSGNPVIHGQTAMEAGMRRQPSTFGDVHAVLEKIGVELEASLGGMVPKCDKCGGGFNDCDNLLAVGCVKYHKVCPSPEVLAKDALTSKATAGAQKSAIRNAPFLLTIRVEVAPGEVITFFFVKDEATRKSSNDMFHVPYLPEDNEHAHSRRKTKHDIIPGSGYPIVSTGGNDGFDPVVASIHMIDDNKLESDNVEQFEIQATISKRCYGLCFTVTALFSWSLKELEGQSLDLKIEPCEA